MMWPSLFAGHVNKDNISPNIVDRWTKKNKDSEISKSQININGVDIDKILISYKFGYGKKGYK